MNARTLSCAAEACALLIVLTCWCAGYIVTNPLPAAHHVERSHA